MVLLHVPPEEKRVGKDKTGSSYHRGGRSQLVFLVVLPLDQVIVLAWRVLNGGQNAVHLIEEDEATTLPCALLHEEPSLFLGFILLAFDEIQEPARLHVFFIRAHIGHEVD